MITNYHQLQELVTPACEQFGVQELSLFGSRVRDVARNDSDFDFVVIFDRTKSGRLSDRFFGLLFYLEDHLPGQVDLIEQEAIRNPHLQQEISREKKLIYGRQNQKVAL